MVVLLRLEPGAKTANVAECNEVRVQGAIKTALWVITISGVLPGKLLVFSPYVCSGTGRLLHHDFDI